MLPNTTPVPHIIIRKLMPLLKDIELRILLIVTDQTLGWIEDEETKRRKERDWISHFQLRKKCKNKNGKIASSRSVSMAIARLVDEFKLLQAMDIDNKILDSADLRMKNGGKIFYRLNLDADQKTLFTEEKATLAKKVQGVPPQKSTLLKNIQLQKKPINKSNTFCDENRHETVDNSKNEEYKGFISFYSKIVLATRGVTIELTPGDKKNLKKRLISVDVENLERMATYFLGSEKFKGFNPSISVFLSKTIQLDIENARKNVLSFRSEVNKIAERYFPARFTWLNAHQTVELRPDISILEIDIKKSL